VTASETALSLDEAVRSDPIRQPLRAELDPATKRWLEAVARGEIKSPSRRTLAELASEFQVLGTGTSLGALLGSHIDNQWLLGGVAGAAVARVLWDRWSQEND
jgi:hypothetical protein